MLTIVYFCIILQLSGFQEVRTRLSFHQGYTLQDRLPDSIPNQWGSALMRTRRRVFKQEFGV